MPDSLRIAFLRETHAQYLLYPTHTDGIRTRRSPDGTVYSIVDFAAAPPPYLTKVYSNPDFTIFHINAGP